MPQRQRTFRTTFLAWQRRRKPWVDAAVARLPELLNDHANCELKAASSALALIYRYPLP